MPKNACAADQTMAPPIANRARWWKASTRMFPNTLATAFTRLCAVSADWSFMGPPLIVLLSGSESRDGPRPCLRRLDLAVARLGVGHQRPDERPRGSGYLLDRMIEHRLVGFGRGSEAAQLADELQRRRPDLLIGCRWFEIE